MEILYFATPADLRRWFEENHTTAQELHLGYYKKETGKPSITWPESVEQALCFGWIDGVRHSIDSERYTIRFTPRKPSSIWSAINIRTAQTLIANGLMQPAGLKAFEARQENRTGLYAHENRPHELPPEAEAHLRANPTAWDFWQQQTPSYRRAAIWWVISAKQEATQHKRLATLIEDCAAGRTIKPLTRAS